MVTLRLMWGLLVLSVVAASPPRYARQIEYDDNNLNVDGDDVYEDYYDVIEKPVIGTIDPDEDIDPSHSASLEEQEEEDVFEKPQPFPSGSEQSGTPMGPGVQGEEERRLMPIDNLQITGNTSGDLGSGSAVTSGDLPDDKASGSGEPLGSGSYGASGDVSVSVDLGSGLSGLSGSGIILISGGEEELHPMLETIPLEASGDFEESVFSGRVEASGLAGVSGESGGSGVPEVSGESGTSGIPDMSGQFKIFEVSRESVVLEVSGESGLSSVADLSGESGFSSVPDLSGESGSSESEEPIITEVPEVSGEPENSGGAGVSREHETSGESGEPETSGGPELSGEHETSGESGEPETSGGPELSGEHETSGESGESETSRVPDVTERPGIIEVFTKPGPFDLFDVSEVPEESGESGVTEAPDIITTMLIPDLDEEEEIFLTTPTTPQEGAGGDIGSGIPDIDSDFDKDTKGMSTCMLCTCLVGSVYCDDLKLDHVPPLSKETTHFYARYNKINRISKSSFANMNKLKRIDLTSNGISRIDDDAFFGLPALEELILRENVIRQLPALPSSMTLIDACHNQLGSTGIQREAFKDMPGLLYLYLTDNNIDHIPVPLPDSLRSLHLQNNNIQMLHEDTFCNPHDLNYIRKALEDVRLDGNPINLSRSPQAYICLPRIPIGTLI